MAEAGEFGFPNEVAGGAPMDGNVRFRARAIEAGAAPAGPVGCEDGRSEGEGEEEGG